MFQIKICGITNTNDARMVAAAGADAVGLNFYPKSPRCVDLENARRIVDMLPAEIVKVGLFVNAEAEEIRRLYDELGLNLIQLHGDEPPAMLGELSPRPVMRAFRLGSDYLYPVGSYLRHCQHLQCMPCMTLIDAHLEGVYGGTGQVVDWEVLTTYQAIRPEEPIPPLVLAGGLTPQNVAEAIRTARPAAVDTASGVESSPGRKDPAAVTEFARAAREAFGSGR